jgi:hypothetical protein
VAVLQHGTPEVTTLTLLVRVNQLPNLLDEQADGNDKQNQKEGKVKSRQKFEYLDEEKLASFKHYQQQGVDSV